MIIQKCTLEDVPQLAVLNKQLIDDEKSTNPMTIPELEERMSDFLNTEYDAYFFIVDDTVVEYAFIKNNLIHFRRCL